MTNITDGIVSADEVTVPPWVMMSWYLAYNVALKGIPDGFNIPQQVRPTTGYQVLANGQLRLFAKLPSGIEVDMFVHAGVWQYASTKQ